MAKLVVVRGDSVNGTDKHHVSGPGTGPSGPATYTGVGDFKYVGSITDSLSDFVTAGGQPVAVITSQSSLDPGESVPPAGNHSGPAGSNFVPPGPVAPTPGPLAITDTIGTGTPSSNAGSGLLTIGGTRGLLDGDKIDTCDGLSVPANSTVTAEGQDFVTCST